MARARHALYKYTGKPCKNGHTGPRYSNGNCVECLLIRESEKYRTDPAFKTTKKSVEADRYRNNVGAKQAYDKKYREQNASTIRTKRKNTYRTKYDKDPQSYLSRNRIRLMREKQQTPKWADRQAIAAVYREAASRREAGEDVEVDHIVPLRGMRGKVHVISGLHVHTNLRIISRSENESKGARRWPGM